VLAWSELGPFERRGETCLPLAQKDVTEVVVQLPIGGHKNHRSPSFTFQNWAVIRTERVSTLTWARPASR